MTMTHHHGLLKIGATAAALILDESEVVLSGTLTADGFDTKRDGIMARCPSKYDEATRNTGQPKKVG